MTFRSGAGAQDVNVFIPLDVAHRQSTQAHQLAPRLKQSRITSITALHELSHGVILLDVLLDHAGVPDGVDQAWQTKHYLGAPVPGATKATVNLAHVVTAVELVVVDIVGLPDEKALFRRDELEPAVARPDPLPENLERPTTELLPDTRT